MLNLKFSIYILLFFLLQKSYSQAPQHWMVFFTDKQQQEFNPYTYFDAKAIERRLRTSIALSESTDWPVNQNYVNQVSLLVNDVIVTSRWLNSVAVEASDAQMSVIRMLPFVSGIEWIEPAEMPAAGYNDYDTVLDAVGMKVLEGQLHSLGVNDWRKAGYDGKGLRIAIFDVGFDRADQIPAFDHIRNEKRLIATRDFTTRKYSENVYYGNGHGTQVWSCIGGKIGDLQIGLATGAEFLLAKTEKNSEKYSEELYWLAAAEWADKNGADIINSSLGYTSKRYFNWQMNGKTTFVTRAANIAAHKGMLVVNAAGNEGADKWHYIGAPADADSVLSVGGIDPATGYHTSFSSYGPTADKRMKPNVSAYGHVVAAAPARLLSAQGTSFASPLVAGFAACAWQSNRSLSNMQLFRAIEKAGSLYPYFDYAHGYGVPQADYFVGDKSATPEPTFKVIENSDSISINIVNKTFGETELQSAVFGKSHTPTGEDPDAIPEYLYYNIMNANGVLSHYYVIEATQPNVLSLSKNDFQNGDVLNVHFAGYSISIKL